MTETPKPEPACAGSARPELPGAGLAKFMRLRGYDVLESAGAYWQRYKHGFYMSIPPHVRPAPAPFEIGRMLQSAHAVGAWYPSLDRPGWSSGLYVCRPENWKTSRKQSQKARRGLERCEIRIATASVLVDQGLDLNLATMHRQGRYDPEFGQRSRWLRLVEAAGISPNIVLFGAFIGARLAAYVIASREDGWLHLLYKMSRTEDLSQRSNYALDYWIIREAAKDGEIKAVSNGSASLAHSWGGHEYKRRLGYDISPHHLVIELHPALARAVANGLVTRTIFMLQRMRPNDRRLELAANALSGAVLSRAH